MDCMVLVQSSSMIGSRLTSGHYILLVYSDWIFPRPTYIWYIRNVIISECSDFWRRSCAPNNSDISIKEILLFSETTKSFLFTFLSCSYVSSPSNRSMLRLVSSLSLCFFLRSLIFYFYNSQSLISSLYPFHLIFSLPT